MKTSIKLMSIAIAVCGFVSTANAQSGVTADPYWSQFLPKETTIALAINTPDVADAGAYWSQFLPKENNGAQAVNTQSGSTVDSYWGQFVPWEHANS